MDDKTLERAASQLGNEAADRIDVEATARAVVERLRTEPVVAPVPWWRRVRVLQGAAAAVVILAAGLFVFGRGGAGEDSLGELGDPMTASIESLSVAELEELADSVLFEAPVHEQVAIGLNDLDEEQLVELLGLMEG